MLDLSVITIDGGQAVFCKTLKQAQEFFYAVQEQRPDISTKNWSKPPSYPAHANTAYILSYRGTRRLLYGSVQSLKNEGIEIIPFEKLICAELTGFEANQPELTSLLGF